VNICTKQREKKCGKLIISFIFRSPRAITSWKINWSKPNSNLICILVWQSNVPYIKWISRQREKKCGKLIICDIFQSPRAITLWKINGSKPNSILICILVWQSNLQNIKWISVSREKKVWKTDNLWYFSKSKGHNFVKNQRIKTKLKLDLYLDMEKQCIKYQMNIC
jgi:hypothetical protein